MAPTPGTLRVSRYFGALGLILAVLYLLVLLPGNANTPKLGIDLVGGVRVIFTAVPPAGQSVTGTSMEQARQIIEDRINGTGVTASTVQIQGDDQLVVQIPGGTSTDVKRLGQAAQLNFRPLVAPAQQVTCTTSGSGSSSSPSASGSSAPTGSAAPSSSAPASTAPSSSAPAAGAAADPSGSATGNALDERKLAAAPTPTGTATRAAAATTPAPAATTPAATTGAATPGATTPAPSASPTGPPPACVANPIAVVQKADKTLATLPTTEAAYDKLTQTQKSEIAAALANVDCTKTNRLEDNPAKPYVACESQSGTNIAYLLGPVIVKGEQVEEANAVAPSTGQGGSQQWTVSLTLKDSGQTAWGKWTTDHNSSSQQGQGATACGSATGGLPCSDYVAFTLDGQVLSAPVTNEPIVGQATQISGNFVQSSANALADSLKYGALPLTFNLESNERVSASLGTSQLEAALLAGGIGLALVVLYSLLYYRGLGLVTIASLIVSGLLTYAMMVILGQQIGFTLDLSGIAGLIVALGITADSFVVFFERIKDEVHEGRSIRVAIPRAWIRARRTVLSADTVSFLAAAILYYFASADVKGFAFTLGLSTILDLVVVFLFTHPIVSLLARSKTFGSPRFTGLNSVRKGGITPDRDEPQAKRAATKRRAKAAGSTVVLDKDDTGRAEADDLDPVEVVENTGTDVDDDAPEQPRRRSAPTEGTAAERAAARRARQRTQRDEGNA